MGIKFYLSGSTQENNIGAGEYGNEEMRMQFLADCVAGYIIEGRGDIEVLRNNGNMSLQATINDSNNKKADYHLALHTNAYNKQARGTEAYYFYKDPQFGGQGKKLAEYVYNNVAPLTSASDRGVHPDNILYSNGLAELRETSAPAALIEIVFHDNIDDAKDYLGKIHIIAKEIAKSIYSFLNIAYYIAPVPKPEVAERDAAILDIKKVSQWADIYIKEFDDMQSRGINVYGLLAKLKKL